MYECALRHEVDPKHSGQFLVLDVQSGDYEIADEDLGASEWLLERRSDAMLYGLQIGEGAAYRIGGHSNSPTTNGINAPQVFED